jgi:tetraacyldisaccharide-1-P 4'-kinase
MRYFNLRINKPKFWDSNSYSFAAVSLMPFSIILKLLFMLKKKLTNKINFKIPIICVGNLYLGGMEKHL